MRPEGRWPTANKVFAKSGRATVLAIVIALAVVLQPASGNAEGPFSTNARAAVLMDAATGAILFQHNANQLLPPASMSKLMTLDLVFEALKAGKLSLSNELTVSENAWRKGGAPSRTASMFVPINTKASIRDLVQGIIVQSGNDAAIAIAEGMAGSEAEFAALMTRKARELGLKQSTFKNATGLDEDGHAMTARELAILARGIIQRFPEFYGMFSQKEFQYRKHKFFNRNPLLSADIGADGLKTGYLKEAGYGLVGSAVKENRRLIVVVMGLGTAHERKSEALRLLEFGFGKVASYKLFDAGETVSYARVWGGTHYYLPLRGQGELFVYLPHYPANPHLRAEIIYASPLKPPIRAGDQVAMLRVTSPTAAVNEVPLYAAENIEPANVLWRGLDSLVFLVWRWLERGFDDLAAKASEAA